jgi:hypothetical protein
VDLDGSTVLGGESILTLDNGEQLWVPFSTKQSQLVYFPEADAYISDNISSITYGGIEGFCDLAAGINPRFGTAPIAQEDVPLVAFTPGLSVSARVEALQWKGGSR